MKKWGDMNYKRELLEKLVPYFREDERYHLLIGDSGFGAIDNLIDEFPNRITNFGVMEQGATGIAAGMAMAGLIPIMYVIVNFLCFRAIEQIRNDVMLQNLNVKFAAVGCNDYFSFLGPSHTCGQDDIKIMNIIGCPVFDPYCDYADDIPFDDMVRNWITSTKASYIRV